MSSHSCANAEQTIVVTCGLPGSGKSTYLAKLGAHPISSDAIRELLADDPTDQTIHVRVFAAIRYLVRQRLAIGKAVTYVDATHLTPEERAPYIRLARAFKCRVEAVFFDVPVEVCQHRNNLRQRVVPPEVIAMMQAKLVPPSLEEGFDHITAV